MSDYPVITVFYNSHELNIKDVESELFTASKEPFHFFLFHNKNLHFNKSIIFTRLLQEKFESKEPGFFYNPREKTVRMHKQLDNFELTSFEQEVEDRYEDYLKKIYYRIECIFQTFTLFMELYKDKPLIFVFPKKLYKNFTKVAEEHKLQFTGLNNSNNLLQKFEIFYWIHYYSRKDISGDSSKQVDEDCITDLLVLQKT